MPFAPGTTKTKSAPVSNANVQRQTLRGFGDPEIDEAQETDVQTQLDHAVQFGHGVEQGSRGAEALRQAQGPGSRGAGESSIQRSAETEEDEELSMRPLVQRQVMPEEDEETVQRQAETGLEEEEEELPVQAKLTIGQPGDKYEQEADRMAAKVMRMAEPGKGAGEQGRGGVGAGLVPAQLQEKSLLQREAMPEEKEEDEVQMRPAVQRQARPGEEEEETIQAKGGTPAVPGGFEGQLASHRGGGQPLSDQTRAFMEPRFGADFGGVRVHETPDLTNAIQAQAFTHGQDIYFNSGKYNPGSSGGKELLAHELTHVVQQSGEMISPLVQKQPATQSNSEGAQFGQVTASKLNIRQKPSVSGEKIGLLSRGQKVTILEKTGEWLKISFQSDYAYVHGDFIKLTTQLESENSSDSNAQQSGLSNGLPSFDSMRSNYPTGSSEDAKKLIGGKVNMDWIRNTCAIRMSRVLNYTGYEIPKNTPRTVSGGDKKRYFFRIRNLRTYIESNFGRPLYYDKPPFDFEELSKLKGVILFDANFSDASGHIALWDGSSRSFANGDSDDYFDKAKAIWLWVAE